MKTDSTLAIAAVVVFVALNVWVLLPVKLAKEPAAPDAPLAARVLASAGSLRPQPPEQPNDEDANVARKPQAGGRTQPKSSADTIGIIIAAALTLMVFSFLYRDNPFFKITEALLVGVGSGIILKEYYYTVVREKLLDRLYIPLFAGEPLDWHDWLLLIPTVLSIMVLMSMSKKLYWVGRWPFAVIIGMTAGLQVPQIIDSFLLKQVEGSFTGVQGAAAALQVPQNPAGFGEQALLIINMLFLTVGVLCVLTYFYFSAEHTGWRKPVSRIGVWILMIAFGASFGYTVMGRLSLLLRRVNFLLSDWLNLI